MTPTQQFIVEILKEGKGYIPALLAFLAALHLPQPSYMKKEEK